MGSKFSFGLANIAIASVFCLNTRRVPASRPRPRPPPPRRLARAALPRSELLLGVALGGCTAIAAYQRLGSRNVLTDCLRLALVAALGAACFFGKLALRLAVGVGVAVGEITAASASAPTSASCGSGCRAAADRGALLRLRGRYARVH